MILVWWPVLYFLFPKFFCVLSHPKFSAVVSRQNWKWSIHVLDCSFYLFIYLFGCSWWNFAWKRGKWLPLFASSWTTRNASSLFASVQWSELLHFKYVRWHLSVMCILAQYYFTITLEHVMLLLAIHFLARISPPWSLGSARWQIILLAPHCLADYIWERI
jgi:hypothetical protein